MWDPICGTWLIHMCDMTLYMWDMTHTYVCRWPCCKAKCKLWVTCSRLYVFTCVTWLIHMWDMTHLYVGHTYVCRWPCFKAKCKLWVTCSRHDAFTRVTWLTHMGDTTHLYVGNDLFICGTWLMCMLGMIRAYVCRWPCCKAKWKLLVTCSRLYVFTCVTWLIHMWDMTPLCVGHDSCIRV